jgi:hypothetical protein
MTDTPPTPKRRRWPWLVVGMLSVVCLVSWWCWPRVDPRFVGRWVGDADAKLPAFTLVLRSSGIAESYAPDKAGHSKLIGHWRWSVRDDVLINRALRRNGLDALKDSILTTFAHVQGKMGPFDRPYGRLSADLASLVVTHPNGRSQAFRRVLE